MQSTSYHHPDFQHMTELITAPTVENLKEWQTMPTEYVIDALNLLPLTERMKMILNCKAAKSNYLLSHYQELHQWDQLPVFRHIVDPTLVWTEEEFNWISDPSCEDAFLKNKEHFVASLERYTMHTGSYHVLCCNLPYDALKRLDAVHPHLWDVLSPDRRLHLFTQSLNHPHQRDFALFLFEKGVNHEDYWATLINKGLFISRYNPLVLQHQDKAPKGFAEAWVCNLDDSEESMAFFGTLSPDVQKKAMNHGNYNIWTKSFPRLALYADIKVLKKHINEYFIDKRISHQRENLAWIYDHFRSNSRLIRDIKQAQQYLTLGDFVRDIREKRKDRVYLGNGVIYWYLTLSVDEDWLSMVKNIYHVDGVVLLSQLVEDVDDPDVYHEMWDCPLPSPSIVVKEETSLYF